MIACALRQKRSRATPRTSGPQVAAVSRGASGSVARSARGEAGAAMAARVRVADTVGAGDAHTAGFLHGYLAGASLDVRPRTDQHRCFHC